MPLLNLALPILERRLPKVIGPTVHGVIDYGHAALFAILAIACRKSNKRAAMAALGTSAFILAQSLLTDYPLGAAPVLSFESHGKLDTSFASTSWALPKLLGFSDTPAARIFEVNSLVEATVVGLTDFNSARARQKSA